MSPGDLAPLPTEINALVAAAEAAPGRAGSTIANAAVPSTAGAAATPTAAAPPVPATTPTKPVGQVVVANAGARVKLTARMDSWVQIYDKGQTIEVPNLPGLLLTTGNIGGLDILIDGQALAALGSVGLVKRDLPLDATGLKSASAVGQ